MQSVSEFSQESYYVSGKYYYYFAISASLFFISQSHLGHLLWNFLIPWQFLMALWRAFWGLFNPLVDDPSAYGVHAFFHNTLIFRFKKIVVAILYLDENCLSFGREIYNLAFQIGFFFWGGGRNGAQQCQLLMTPFGRNIIEAWSPNYSLKPLKCFLSVVWQSLCFLD